MSDNVDKNEIRKAIDRLQLEHPVHFAYDATRIIEPGIAKAVQDEIDRMAKMMAKDETIHIICEMAKLYLDGVKLTVEPKGLRREWIPCSERLPEKYRAYIVTDETGAVFEYDYNDLTTHDGKWSYCRCEIVAWMPLPEPYKKEGEAE